MSLSLNDADWARPMDYRYTFTVFTPTYNRAHTLPRVYASLVAQTWTDFEWLIIDDGSTDATRALVEQWQTEARFPIVYHYQANQGKHVAHNRALEVAQGQFLLTFDSDDACVPNALERFNYHWNQIPVAQQPHFSAVTGLCMDEQGQVIGDRFPQDVFDSNSLACYYTHKIRGEKWGFQRLDVLRQFPFPTLENWQGHVPEGVVWAKIARAYQTRYINEPLRIYHRSVDSLSKPKQPHTVAAAGELQHRLALNEHIDYFAAAPQEFLRSAVHYSRFAFHRGYGLGTQWQNLQSVRARALWLAALPAGFLFYRRDRRKAA